MSSITKFSSRRASIFTLWLPKREFICSSRFSARMARKSLAERPNGNFGPVPLSAVVDASGLYVLGVDAGPQNKVSGRYQIKITAERSPTPDDLKRVEAERVFLDGLNAPGPSTPDTLKKIIAQWEATLPIWRSLHDNVEEATMESAIAAVYGKSAASTRRLITKIRR